MIGCMARRMDGVECPTVAVNRIAVTHRFVGSESFIDKGLARQAGRPGTAGLARMTKGIYRRIRSCLEGRDPIGMIAVGMG